MSERSARLSLPYLMPAQAQKHVTHNEALQSLDLWVQLAVESCDAETPPAAPEEGQVWALGAAPTGPWAGHAHEIALWSDAVWRFEAPPAGVAVVDKSTGGVRIWDGSDWQAPSLPDFAAAQGLGLNTTSDAQNRLSVAAPATLLTHEGGGHQLKINKAADTDTASLLFQSGWSGRAEMGTTGADDFSIKVSPDGATWTEALTVDRVSGHLTGAAVQEDALDDTPGTLLTVGGFGLGKSEFLTGTNALVSRDLKTGFYSYAANGATDAPESAAWGHNMLVLRGHPALGSERMAALSVRTTGGSAIRLWVGAQGGGGSASDPLFWTEIFHRHNLVGTVAESSGTPTGAVMESGTNANGSYIRWADGTQFCTNANAAVVTPPAAFVGAVTKIDGDKLWIGRWF